MNGISFISSWIKDIVVLFTLISIAELVMPKGNMKKYIELVIGILIIFTIISPFARIMKYDFELENSIYNYTKKQEEEIQNEDNFYDSQGDQVKSLVIEKIKGEILNILETQDIEYDVLDIEVDMDLNTDKNQIKYIKLILGREKKDNDISIKKISPVKINTNSNEEKKGEDINIDLKYEDLKGLIGERFSIDSKNVIIELIEEDGGNYEKNNRKDKTTP